MVELVAQGNPGSWFEISPWYKYKDGTDVVKGNDFVVLKHQLLGASWGLHCAEDAGVNDRFEVSLSDTPHAWQLHFMARGTTMLMPGRVVRFVQAETETLLGAARREDREVAPYLVQKKHDSVTHKLNARAKVLWSVQRPNAFSGGVIRWGEPVLLRHLLTGKFLERGTDNKWALTAQPSYMSEIVMEPLTGSTPSTSSSHGCRTDDREEVGDPIQIRGVRSWLRSGCKKPTPAYLHYGNARKPQDVFLPRYFSRHLEVTPHPTEEDTIELTDVDMDTVRQVEYVLAITAFLKKWSA
jgi:hypothetical protein